MLDQIILKLMMSTGVSDFLPPSEESSKGGLHLVINIG